MILAFDTCLGICSVAIGDGGALRASRSRELQRGHAEVLIPMIATTLAAAELAPDQVDRIAVTCGPGSFTGIRVGVAAARGLALSLGVPAAGFTSLERLAAAARAQRFGAPVLAVISTRGDRVYHQAFAACGMPEAPPGLSSTPLALAHYKYRSGLVIGSGSQAFAAGCPRLEPVAGAQEAPAEVLWHLAARSDADRWATRPAPLYLRPPDARLPAGAA